MARRGKRLTRKLKKTARKTRRASRSRRGGVEEAREIVEAAALRKRLEELKANPSATPEQIRILTEEYEKADKLARIIARFQRSERF